MCHSFFMLIYRLRLMLMLLSISFICLLAKIHMSLEYEEST